MEVEETSGLYLKQRRGAVVEKKLIGQAVHSFKSAEEKFIKTLSDREISEEKLDASLGVLVEMRRTIERLFKDNPSLEINNEETARVIRQIRDNKDIYGKIMQELSVLDKGDIEEYYGENWLVLLNEEYDLENFFLRRIEAGSILLREKPPKNILRLFKILRECYTTGQYEAAIILCRAMIEESLKSNNMACRLLKKQKNVRKNLKNRIQYSPLPSGLKQKADVIRESVNEMLHEAAVKAYPVRNINITGTNKQGEPIFCSGVAIKEDKELREKSLEFIRDTIAIIESLCR